MIHRLLPTILCIIFLLSPMAEAATESSPFSAYVDLRYRYEYQHHFNLKNYGETPKTGESCDGFWLQRLRTGGSWQFHPRIKLAVGLQDSRVFTSDVDPDTFFWSKKLDHEQNSYEDRWELYETYLEIKPVPTLDWTLKAGRQTIVYGNNRIFGPGNWGNSGRYQWDALKTSFKHQRHFIDLLWGGYILHEPEQFSLRHRHNGYGGGCYSHLQLTDDLALEPFYLLKYDRHERFASEDTDVKGDLFSHNAGARLSGNIPALFFDMTLVHQWGDYGKDRLRAWGGHLLLGHRFKGYPLNPSLIFEYSYASGDSDPDDGTVETFIGVFGARDRMYGRMNLFDWSNLHDLQCNLHVEPHKKLKIQVEGHRFWLAQKKDGWSLNSSLYRDKSGRSGRHVGDELDLIVTWTLPRLWREQPGKIIVMSGYSRFWPGAFAEKVADHVAADWFFTQVNYKLRF